MTKEIIREIIDKVKEDYDDYLIDCEKADFLSALRYLYPDECEDFKEEISELINQWD